ncbi:hypothetical protein ACFHW0_31425, partial [Micromonospora sp. LOL_025]
MTADRPVGDLFRRFRERLEAGAGAGDPRLAGGGAGAAGVGRPAGGDAAGAVAPRGDAPAPG